MRKCVLLASMIMALAINAATPVEPHDITLDVMEKMAGFYADRGTIDHTAFRDYAANVLTDLNYREVSSYDLYPNSDGPNAETMWFINTYMAAAPKPDGYVFAPTDDGLACMVNIIYYDHSIEDDEAHMANEIAVTLNTLNIAQYNLIKAAAERTGYTLQQTQHFDPSMSRLVYTSPRFELFLETFVQPNGTTAYSAYLTLSNTPDQ